jgi:hypothetical protein
MEAAHTSSTGGPGRKRRATTACAGESNKCAAGGQEQLQEVLLRQGGVKLAVNRSVAWEIMREQEQ